jgi:drug/metabolite transporter (DMT)-like permease
MKTKRSNIRIEYSLMLIVSFFWAIGHPLTRLIVTEIHPFQIATMAIGIGSFSLFIFLTASGKIKKIKKFNRRDIFVSLGLGVLGFFLYHTLAFSALARIPASMNAVLISTNVIFIALLASLILKERILAAGIIGIALALCGVILVTFNKGFTFGAENTDISVIGCFFSVLAAFLFALYSVLGKKILLSNDPLIVTALAMLSGTILLAILTGATVGFSEIITSDWATLLILVFIGITNGIAYPLWFTCLKSIPAAHIAIYIYLTPVFAIILSLIILNERFSWLFWAGVFFILGGIIITNRFGSESLKTNRIRK